MLAKTKTGYNIVVIAINCEHALPAHGCRYFFHGHHRSRRRTHKSQWTITMPQELDCFTTALCNQWTNNDQGWGVRIENMRMIELGRNAHGEPLSIAKFQDAASPGMWHGYPADYARNIQDRPNVGILISWREMGIIHKHQIAKVRAGKKCAL